MCRHHVFVKIPRQVQLAEVGPRFEMKRKSEQLGIDPPSDFLIAYEIRQGTLEQAEAEKEWVLAHYSRTAKKRRLLTGTISRNQKENPEKRTKR